jgi:hypothetical protein
MQAAGCTQTLCQIDSQACSQTLRWSETWAESCTRPEDWRTVKAWVFREVERGVEWVSPRVWPQSENLKVSPEIANLTVWPQSGNLQVSLEIENLKDVPQSGKMKMRP